MSKLVHRKKTPKTYALTIVHLYPKEMNIYGDTGNVLALRRRAEWRGISVQVKHVGVNDPIPDGTDIILGGGGQDSGQGAIQQDLQTKAVQLHKLANDNVVMLMICGMYQLFGRFFRTNEGKTIQGIGVLPLETVAGTERFIGNTCFHTHYGELVGYENHSGLTKLDSEAASFGIVQLGAGNNGQDGTEGCRVHNVFGTYSHGPILPKNPVFADALLQLALERKYGSVTLPALNDDIEQAAYETAKARPR